MGKLIPVKTLKFDELWSNYPSTELQHPDPSTGKETFSDYCAIHMSESLMKSGASTSSFKGAKCWNCPGTGQHILRAQEMSDWLSKRPFAGCPDPHTMTGKDFKEKCEGKNGIIFFKDYWQRNGEKGTKLRTGDHIDLWKDGKLAGSGIAGSFIRITLGFSIDGIWSDFNLATQVKFWEMK